MSSYPRPSFRGPRVRANRAHNSSRKDPPEEVIQNCNREVDEVLRYALPLSSGDLLAQRRPTVHRVLRKGGIFIYLTFGQPHFRRRYLDRPNTTLEIRKLGDAFHYFLYIVRT